MKLFIALSIALFALPVVHAADLAFGPSARPQSYAVSLRGSGQLAPEIEFISEGRQPDGIPNINRVFMLNMVATTDLAPGLQAFVKAGLASSRWSTNGSGNGRPDYDMGVGITYRVTPRWVFDSKPYSCITSRATCRCSRTSR